MFMFYVNTPVGCRGTGLAVVFPSNLQTKVQIYYSQNGLMMIQAKFGGDPGNTVEPTVAVSDSPPCP